MIGRAGVFSGLLFKINIKKNGIAFINNDEGEDSGTP